MTPRWEMDMEIIRDLFKKHIEKYTKLKKEKESLIRATKALEKQMQGEEKKLELLKKIMKKSTCF